MKCFEQMGVNGIVKPTKHHGHKIIKKLIEQ